MGIARLNGGTITANTQLRLSVKLGSTTIAQGPLVTLVADEYMQELGSIQLPPYLFGLTAPKALTLSLSGKQSGGGTIILDFIEFFPIDCYRNLKQLNYAVPNGDIIYADELSKPQMTYGIDSGNKSYSTWIPRGSMLKLIPGILQQIHFLFDEQDKSQNVGRKSTVKVYCRPRRLTL